MYIVATGNFIKYHKWIEIEKAKVSRHLSLVNKTKIFNDAQATETHLAFFPEDKADATKNVTRQEAPACLSGEGQERV